MNLTSDSLLTSLNFWAITLYLQLIIRDIKKIIVIIYSFVSDPPIRMSELANTSIISTWSDKNNDDQEQDITSEPADNIIESTILTEILNNSKTNLDNQIEQHLNQIYNNTKEIEEKPIEKVDENDNNVEIKKQLTLVIPRPSLRIVNDITKTQTPDVQRNSTQLVFPHEDIEDISIAKQNQGIIGTDIKDCQALNDAMNKQKQIRPIMGKNALLKKANIDRSDSLIVQDIILDKYNPVLNHYVTKMYQRRLSRSRLDTSCEDDFYSDGVCIVSILELYTEIFHLYLKFRNCFYFRFIQGNK